MSVCSQCQSKIAPSEGHQLGGALLCDECYLDAVWLKVAKPHNPSSGSEFFQ